jgi:acylphosphatase
MEAEKKNIHGFVKNRAEDEVEALLLGHDKDVEDVVHLCRKGPLHQKWKISKLRIINKNTLKNPLIFCKSKKQMITEIS